MKISKKKSVKLVSFLCAAALFLTACSSASSTSQTSTTPSSTVSSSEASGTRTVTDTDGNSVEIPKKVERVGATIGAFAQVTAMLGGEKQLVATTDGLSEMFKTVWPNVNPGNYSVENAESIIESGAQVVYGPNIAEDIQKQLKDAGISVVKVGTFSTAEELQACITVIGNILGNDSPEKAEKFNKYYTDNIKMVEDKTKDLTQAEKMNILQLRYSGNAYSTVNKTDISSYYASCAGGIVSSSDYEGPASSTAMTVSTEQVVTWDPNVIFTMGEEAKNQILSDSALASVSAIQNQKVYVTPSGTYPWGVRSAEGALMPLFLAKIMYPTIFEDLSIEEKTKEFYKEFYNYELSDEQVTTIMNGGK